MRGALHLQANRLRRRRGLASEGEYRAALRQFNRVMWSVSKELHVVLRLTHIAFEVEW
jgi:hypothetical protein